MSGVSTLGQSLAQVQRIKDQQSLFSLLTMQLATGKKTQRFSGLGTDVLTSKRARADFKSLDVYITNIDNTDRRIKLMLTAIEEFKAQAEIFANAIIGFPQEGVHQEGDIIFYDDPLTPNINENTQIGVTSADQDVAFEILTDLATNLFGFMTDLLNVQDGDRYLLGGSDTLTQPLVDSGNLDAAMNTLIAGWKAGTITSTELIADLRERTATVTNPNAITDTIIGYSPTLSAGNSGNVFVQVDNDSEVQYTALANDEAFRDILVAISYIKNPNLPPIGDAFIPPNTFPGVPDVEGAPGVDLDAMKANFYQVFNEMSVMMNQAIERIDNVRFSLENSRARIANIKLSHEDQQGLLLETIANVEDADMNQIAMSITTLQIQLEASFRVTARVQELSLTRFI